MQQVLQGLVRSLIVTGSFLVAVIGVYVAFDASPNPSGLRMLALGLTLMFASYVTIWAYDAGKPWRDIGD